jgi:hypothetical protein
VERILAGLSRRPAPAAQPGPAGLDGTPSEEAIRVLFERRLAMLLAGEVAPSMTELQKLLEMMQRLDALERLERLERLKRLSRRKGEGS